MHAPLCPMVERAAVAPPRHCAACLSMEAITAMRNYRIEIGPTGFR
jgi:hypothetical protein